MSVIRYLKKFLRASDKLSNSIHEPIDSFIDIFNYPVDNKLEDVSQRNNDKYGFNVFDDLPFGEPVERYNQWLYNDDEEE